MSLARLLGPGENRYFASGYRDVAYRERHVARRLGNSVKTTYPVARPDAWSLVADERERTVHLGTIDVVVIALSAAEAFDEGTSRTGHCWICSPELRAGSTPSGQLSNVPTVLRLAEESEDDGDESLWTPEG